MTEPNESPEAATGELLRPVLVVDDSPADRDALMHAYRRFAPEQPLVFCSGATEALERIEAVVGLPSSDHPAFVLLDVNMPDRGGIELLGILRQRYPLLPVVMLSGSARAEDRRAAYSGGAAGFFVKPMGLAALAEVLTAVHVYWQRNATLAERVS